MSNPVTIFFSYADNKDDRVLFARLEKHLKIFEHNKRIASWNKQDILAGQNWQHEINVHFEQAQIILLLISPDFMASPFCYQNEMKQALERQARNETCVIPILLRDVYYKDAPFAQLAALPTYGRFVSSWGKRTDVAFVEIATALDEVITRCAERSASSQTTQKESPMHEDTITLILDALIYGVKTQATVPEIKDDYERLHMLLARRCTENADAHYALTHFLQRPQDWRGPMLEALEALRVNQDQAIVAAAENLLATKREPGTSKYVISNTAHIDEQYIGDNHTHYHYSSQTEQDKKQG